MSQFLQARFPQLASGSYQVTSPATWRYNCVAWAAGDDTRWWDDPVKAGYYWPAGMPPGERVDAVADVFQRMGYEECDSAGPEPSCEKVAIYGKAGWFQHIARQLPDGSWSSKMGACEDITHDTLARLHGNEYGIVERILKRRRPA